MDLIKREQTLRIIQHRLEQEELNLKNANSEYKKRLASYAVALLRDLKYMIQHMNGYKSE